MMIDLIYFGFVPMLFMVYILLFGRGSIPTKYKIVKETNSLGETTFEVWFEYPAAPLILRTWSHEMTFNREQDAEEYVARQSKDRTVIKEGSFK